MSKLLSALLALSLAGTMPAFAVDAHHPEDQTPAKPAAKSATKAPARTAPAATPQLLENAKRLQEQARGIARAKTPAQRETLLREHVQTLQEGMMMTQGMMGGAAVQPGWQGGMAGGMMGPGMMGPGMMGPGMMGLGMMGQGMMGHGMMGHGMMGQGMMEGMGMLAGVDLSDEQRKRLYAIHDGARKQHWDLMGRIMDERTKLRDLYMADKHDPAAIGAEYQRIFDLRRQMIEASVTAHNQAEEVLTPEQRQALRDRLRRGDGCGMMGY